MTTDTTPLVWVDQPTDLDRLVETLLRSSRIAVDTESNSLYAYQEQVCLIQFSTPEADFLVDPLCLKDLTPLGAVFADERIEKVFHAAEYDLICLKRDFGFIFRHIFDTMHAARILGRREVGLASLLKQEFGLQLEKHYQRADWSQRPLPPAMLDYARHDTHYLLPLRERLAAALQQKGLWELAQEDFERLTEVSVPVIDLSKGPDWNLAQRYNLSPQQMAVLHALYAYRDEQARLANLPHFKILSNEALLEIALALPKSPRDLSRLGILSAKQRARFQEGLLTTIREALTAPPPPRPRNGAPDEAVLARLEHLRQWRKQVGRRLGVESDIILPRDLMERIARENPTHPDDLARLMQSTPWRFKRFGGEILRVLQEANFALAHP
ncbi:ribonuclease D [Thermanaerothrix daxensis]|uniref:ribonuclease D n=1 Tax=Thermanaerothrix daxensis TaxID=869279 RepID=UPI0006C8F45F|nr:ribonuclease D [Thermanaerothrix daxensis]